MKLTSKSEWFELDSPLGEPDQKWNYSHKYNIERRINNDGSTVWYGIGVNWKKEKDGPWTVLSEDETVQPLEKYLPDIVYPAERTYWKKCATPIYEELYNQLILL